MPVAEVFVDTNVLLYMHDARNPEKRGVASRWLHRLARDQRARVNLQVLNELASVLERKRWFDTYDDVVRIVDHFAALGSSPITLKTVETARAIKRANGFSWWDCLLLGSALELGCSHFLSEDLHDGQQIGGMMVVNPFLHDPADVLGP
ncbi:MAG: PIN domain-containing protein [Mesorhizobium sp.]